MILNIFNKNDSKSANEVVNYFLIDYENVNDKGLNGLEYLKRGDVLYIFHNDTTSKMTIEMARTLFNLPEIGIEVKNVQVQHLGKNAADMILAATLGMLVSVSKEDKVRVNIISKDKGLCSLIENMPEVTKSLNLTTSFTYNKASSIEECFVEKKPIHKAKQAVSKVKKTVTKNTKKEKSAVKENKKPVAKETKPVKNTAAKAPQKQNKKPISKQQKSNLLQHDENYKKDINELRKKFINVTALDQDMANKLANSLTGVIVKKGTVSTKMNNYLKDLSEKETNAVKSLESDIKALIEKY